MELEEIRHEWEKLQLKDGEVLIWRTASHPSESELDLISEALNEQLGVRVLLFVLGPGEDLTAIPKRAVLEACFHDELNRRWNILRENEDETNQ